MRHTLILQGLNLPLLVALGISGLLVAVAPFTRFATQTSHGNKATSVQSVTSEVATLNSKTANTADFAETEATSAAATGSRRTTNEGDSSSLKFAETSAAESIHPPVTKSPKAAQSAINTGTFISAFGGRIDATLKTAESAFGLAIQTARRQFYEQQGWEPPASESGDRRPLDAGPSNRASTSATLDSHTDPVHIRNSAAAGYSVSFLMNGETVELAPGEETSSTAGPTSVHFDRGGEHGSIRKDLKAGRYEFRLTPAGWELFSASASQ